MRFYQERHGDYLMIDEKTGDYYKSIGQPSVFVEGRATAIKGELGSVQTTRVAWAFLRTCRRVSRKDVPRKWLEILVL